MDQEDDLLDSLLAAATDELEKLNDSNNSQEHLEEQIVHSKTNVTVKQNEENKSQKKFLQETNLFQFESNLKLPLQRKSNSVIHNGDTDSSDDEGNRNYEDQKYNQYGREIKSLMSTSQTSAIEANSISSNHYGVPKKRVSTWKKNPNNTTLSTSHTISSSPSINTKPVFGVLPEAHKKFQDVFMDPIFGMRIVNPLVSSALLIDKMQGRLPVKYSELSRHIFAGNLKDKDWVLCAVVCSKSPPKVSNKGSQYSIWTLTDLKDDIKTFSLFLFSGAHTSLWKTAIGTVIGILNPNIMDQKEGSKNEVSLSVSNAQKIMIFGQSKDFGICKSIKKNGDKCTAVVNLSKCEFCIYHIKQEYQKCSKRSELQANFAGQGLINLRNKVLGKNEVFYAGKSYTAIPAKKSKKLETRDHNILQNLSGTCINSNSTDRARKGLKRKKGVARQLDINPAQRAKDLELLKKLGGTTSLETKTNFSGKRSDDVTLEESKATALSVINKLKVKRSESEEQVIKKSQFNLKSDLFINVENKKIFSGNISEEVSLEESKNRALDVISKLKDKSQKTSQIGDRVIKNAENESGLTLAEIEEQLDYEDLNYSEDEQSDLISSKSSCIENKEGNDVSDLKFSKSVKSSITETTKSILNNDSFNKESDNSPRSSRKDKNIKDIITPKFGQKNESFGKISPKLSATRINPNNFKESRTTYVSTPKSTSKLGKYETSSFKPNNLNKTFSNDLDTSLNKDSESSVICTNRNNTQVSLSLNNGLLDPNRNFINNSEKSDIDQMAMGIPMLSSGETDNIIDLSKPIKPRHVNRAKLNAIKYIQRNGPIKKDDPNSIKSSSDKKRKIESVLGLNNDNNSSSGNDNQNAVKKSKLQESEFISDRFKKMMAMTSKYAGLLEQHDDEEKEKYFKKLEIKEQMEEKMANTHKVKCKAVRCLQCKYISFSASEFCKNERHPLKIFDALKRFYKCSNCQNRTVTLELIPTTACNNCGSSKWEKTGMMKEKIAVVQHNLSIRGGEQKFINSNIADANLDLLVPDN